MIDGSVNERVYDEMEALREQRLYAHDWVDALARYCVARESPGPVPQWTPTTLAVETRAEEWLTDAGVDVEALGQADGTGRRNGDRRSRCAGLLTRKQIKTETATRLIDAAFLLGMATARKRALAASVAARFWDSGGGRLPRESIVGSAVT